MEKKYNPAQLPTGGSHFDTLTHAIAEEKIEVSKTSEPGGGAHATFFFGSPVAEQAAADKVKNEVLAYLQNLPAVPRTKDEFVVLLKALIEKMKGIQVNDQNLFLINGAPDATCASWFPHYRAPVFAAAEAMRQRLLVIVQSTLRALTMPEDAF